jgi:hypothetical protein
MRHVRDVYTDGGIFRQPSVALEQRHGVKAFSLRKSDALFAWLDQLEVGMIGEHRVAVEAAYPASGTIGANPKSLSRSADPVTAQFESTTLSRREHVAPRLIVRPGTNGG